MNTPIKPATLDIPVHPDTPARTEHSLKETECSLKETECSKIVIFTYLAEFDELDVEPKDSPIKQGKI